ncbi:NUDIX domain-containing protein [Actinomadura rudentiformis]|uniref:NUDIX domain-containing protein n=1 Tax=Actinomadura rudentiformis TaxID=359158 RepID=UPI00299012F0|nr:NUDIX domain-containing protein [Actinomadura rudentiformis]
MPNSRHSVSVAGVIVDDQGRVLLIQRRDNVHWKAPGGVLEQDEDIIISSGERCTKRQALR